MKNKILYILFFFMFSGCSFLDEHSQDLSYVHSYVDLDELLVGEGYMPVYDYPRFSNYGYGGHRHILHYLADEVQENNSSYDGWFEPEQVESILGYFTWNERTGLMSNQGNIFREEDTDWIQLYKHINITNNVIHLIDDFIVGSEDEVNGAIRVKGEAYFLRAAYYFILVNMYGKPYSESSSTDLGVPIKTTSQIEDILFERKSIQEVYNRILEDLSVAEECLSSVPGYGTIHQADSNAVFMLASRVHLYMQNWETSLYYTQKVINSNFSLVDLNQIDKYGFLSFSSPEAIFTMGGNIINSNMPHAMGSFRVSDELYNSYNDSDLRKTNFYWKSGNFIGYTKVSGYPAGTIGGQPEDINDPRYYQYNYSYTDLFRVHYLFSDNFFMRLAEAYLNGAEAAAQSGDETTAKNLLEELRVNRIKNSDYSPINYSGKELIDFIRDERFRELSWEGHRWFDLRRYRVDKKYPSSKEIRREHYIYDDYAPIEKRVFVLEKDDPGWTLPIPYEVLQYHTGMQNNETKYRSYSVEPL